ncbi:acyl-CoA dehydrogenase [Streptomyces sp. S07_1.15]|uniref:acyl-CoA dehydrogenase n=1 Tax=Streptomyces sp. S07_1.15 TaxID=2873925 RepID=UPI001D13EE16|nr:acyl-CoA dehydrogenase [Streptomyces sp. S07_1.15]MCC3653773.1 acyl-CoA dehydrogenase [Streptomyces sp. S07_1.15]
MTGAGTGTGPGPERPEERIDRLERAFGPLEEPGNPLGQDALLAADARGEVPPGAERVLDEQDFNAEFVPAPLGGRLDRLDVLGRVLRPVFRRDASLGFGYGLNCFFSAVPVWTAGRAEQRHRAARLLLGGDRIAVARHEVAHGNDFVRDEFAAVPDGAGGFLLSGRKSVIANAARAAGLVVFARTSDAPGGLSHSVLLLDRRELPAGRLRHLGRHTTTGMRSAEFGGLEAVDCPVPGEALIGGAGDGYELSLRSSLVIRGLIPSIVLSGADTALRTVAGFAARGRADGRSPLDGRHVRSVLTGAFLDQLLSDCLALVATRALHVLPRSMSAYAAAAAYVAPKLVAESMDALSAVLGEGTFAEDGRYGMFRKHLRDLPVTSLGHAGSAGRQVSILPQLPFFARHAWFSDPEPPPALFRLHGPLPPLDLSSPALLGGSDPLAATLVEGAAGEPADSPLHAPLTALTGELRELRKEFAAIEPGDRAALVSSYSFGLADRYALLLTAAACLGVWRAQLHGDDGDGGRDGGGRDGGGDGGGGGARADAFLADPAWVTAALHRLCHRLGLQLPPPPEEAGRRVVAEVLARLHGRRSYDLYGTALA